MTQVDYEASLFFSKINQLDKQEIFDNIKERYLSLNNSLQEGLETFFQQFSFWGKLDRKKNLYEEIQNRATFLKEKKEDLEWLYQSLQDYRSKKILLAILKNYYYYDFSLLGSVRENCYSHYFDLDLLPSLEDAVFVDVGAYIGDTVDDFLKNFNYQYRKIYCYEVTVESFAILKDKFCLSERIICQKKAVYDHTCKLSLTFHPTSFSANRITEEEGEIEAITLDEDIKEKIDFLKMDIEGSERKALIGARKHIQEDHPYLMISVYHGFEDLVEIPKLILQWNANYQFCLRYYGNEVFPTEIVLLAIPKKSA